LPVLLITVPVVIYVFAQDGVSASTVIFTVWIIIAGLSDNVLKPMLLGRGVAVPMPVVLIGALGGMVTSGIIGLFTGPVILAVGYELFIGWVYQPADVTEVLDDTRRENLP
jgi:predicted PurR-regulated permease PerM